MGAIVISNQDAGHSYTKSKWINSTVEQEWMNGQLLAETFGGDLHGGQISAKEELLST